MTRRIGAWVRLAPWVLLAASIIVVEVGWRAPASPRVDTPAPRFAEGAIGRLRAAPSGGIDDDRAAAIVSGVTFGRTEHIAPADQDLFLASGLWHLLAASGQNIALVATCCILLARAFGRTRVAGSVVALVAIPAYVLVVGGGASIVRAGIMGELAVIAWLFGVLADMRHLIVLTAAAICWIWPGAHRGLGMQLSFACVAALAWWATPATRRLTAWGVPTWLAAGLVASGVCSFVTAPILVLRTGAAPFTGTLANLLAVPLAGGILVIGLATSLVATFGPQATARLAAVGFHLTGWFASLLLALARRGADLPLAQTSSHALAIGAPSIGLALILLPRVRMPPSMRRGSRLLLVGGLATCCALAIAQSAGVPVPLAGRGGPPPPIATGAMRIGVLDIGQGDATLVATRTRAVLIDSGPPDGQVVRRVHELGVDRVDGLVMTHDSLDHRGGYDAVLASLHPRWIIKARGAAGPWEHVRATAPELIEVCAGATLRVDAEVVLRFLHPTCDGHVVPRTTDLHNDGAIVTLVEHGDIRVLVPADAEAPVLVHLPIPPLDLLRVSHHGSSDPWLPQLIRQVHPQLAAISVGEGNSYGHPRHDTLASLEAGRVPTYRTDRDGTLTFDSDGSRLVLR